MNTDAMPTCRGLDCQRSELVAAHIIPKGVARFTRQNDGNVILTRERTQASPQLGETDWNILCAECDRILGGFDNALIDAAKRFKRLHRNAGRVWELPAVDSVKFAKAAYAILWRASLSKRNTFAKFSLGEYEDAIRDLLFGRTTFTDRPDISLLVQRYTSKFFDPSKLYMDPFAAPLISPNAAVIGVAGFRFIAKFDRLPLDAGRQAFDVARTDRVRGTYVEIERTQEFDFITDVVVRDIGRSAGKGAR